MLKYNWHNPVHLFRDDTPYFVTGAIFHKRLLLSTQTLKNRVIAAIQHYFEKYKWELHHWVVLDNHYHILGQSRDSQAMPKIIQGIHGSTSSEIRRANGAEKPIWWNYWDYCPRDERDYYIRMNYLLNNPVKHGYVDDLADYPFSSFERWCDELDREKRVQQFKRYAEYKTLVLHEALDDDF